MPTSDVSLPLFSFSINVGGPEDNLATFQFSEGRALFWRDGCWGYLNREGFEALWPLWPHAGRFHEGLAWVLDTLWACIDTSGTWVIRPSFRDDPSHQPTVCAFSEGRAAVRDYASGEFGYVDRSGTMVIAPRFAVALGFSGGLAAVEVDDKWGYIDTTGNMVIPAQFLAVGPFKEGLAAVNVEVE